MVASVYYTVRHLEYNVGHRAGRWSSQCCFFLKEQPEMERENMLVCHYVPPQASKFRHLKTALCHVRLRFRATEKVPVSHPRRDLWFIYFSLTTRGDTLAFSTVLFRKKFFLSGNCQPRRFVFLHSGMLTHRDTCLLFHYHICILINSEVDNH